MSSAPSTSAGAPFSVVGRYAIFDEIAAGGMATVHLGRLLGAAGFSRNVAVKRLHPQFARDQEFAAMFMDEARLAARINHSNVVQTLDVVPDGRDILLVMEYVHGVPFAQLLRASKRMKWRVPAPLIASVMVGALEGLHAAHEVRNETGQPLGVVHRDVSPQNVLVGTDGVARVIDFGVAKAVGKMHATREGQLKGKLAYMSPEQVRGADVTRLSDVFSASIVLWEALMAERLFKAENPAQLIVEVMSEPIRPPRSKLPDLSPALEAVVMKGLERDPAARFQSAREMAVALESAVGVAPSREVGEWVEAMAGPVLAARAKLLEAIERAVAASTTAGEQTRIDELKASLVAWPLPRDLRLELDPTSGVSGVESGSKPRVPATLKSGPFPIAGALSDAERVDSTPFDATMPQKTASARPVAPPTPAPQAAGLGVIAPASPADGAAPSADPAANAGPPRGEVVRRRIPIRAAPHPDAQAERGGLRDRLVRPMGAVGLGVAVSLVDFGLRQAAIVLPVKPIWLAEILVVAGVIWAFVVVFLPERD